MRTAPPQSGGAAEFGGEALLDWIAVRSVVLHTVHESEFGAGIIENQLPEVIESCQSFAAQFLLDARIGEDSLGADELRIEKLEGGHQARLEVRFLRDGNPILRLPLHLYRRRGGILRCEGDVRLAHLPRARGEELALRGKGHVYLETLLGDATPTEPEEQVDAVYTWVNADDPEWQRLHQLNVGGQVDLDRYRQRDELRYSLRSLACHAGWLRRIHIVSNCAPPEWLDLDHARIRWVRHADILAPEVLPTFNSHAIEAALPRIPELASRFVYLNDDFFLTRPARRRRFFDGSGRSIAFLEKRGLVGPDRRRDEETWYESRLHAQRALLTRFGHAATRLAQHAPYAVDRDTCLEMLAAFPEDLARTLASRQRSATDMPFLCFLYPHYAIHKGVGVSKAAECATMNALNHSEFSLPPEAEFLCINDGGGTAKRASFDRAAGTLMAEFFPIRAPWEREL